MRKVNSHEAKTKLSRLVEQAAAPQRIGFMADEITVPDDFDRMGEAEIAAQFDGDR
jgi:hypothetical protein